MGESVVVDDGTSRIDLPCGYWIELKDELEFGEEQRIFSAGLQAMRPQGSDGAPDVVLDMARADIVKILTWVTDWNLPDRTGKTLGLTRSTVEKLRPKVARQILAAIDSHQAVMAGNAGATHSASVAAPSSA